MVCLLVCLSVSLSVTIVSPAKTAELIEMPFVMWTRMGPLHIKKGISISSAFLQGSRSSQIDRQTTLFRLL